MPTELIFFYLVYFQIVIYFCIAIIQQKNKMQINFSFFVYTFQLTLH